MKKILTSCIGLFTLSSAYALPVVLPYDDSIYTPYCAKQNWCEPCPSICDLFSFGVGFYGHYVFDRFMQLDEDGVSNGVRNTNIYTNAGLAVVNFADWLDIFGTFGGSRISIDTPLTTFSVTGIVFNNTLFIETFTGFEWSVGLHATVYKWCGWSLNAEVQYLRTNPQINYVRTEGSFSVYLDQHFHYQETQVAGGLSYCFMADSLNAMVIPFADIKWSRANISVSNTSFLIDFLTTVLLRDLKSSKEVGAAFGVVLAGQNGWGLTVEGCFGDELAVHVNGHFQF